MALVYNFKKLITSIGKSGFVDSKLLLVHLENTMERKHLVQYFTDNKCPNAAKLISNHSGKIRAYAMAPDILKNINKLAQHQATDQDYQDVDPNILNYTFEFDKKFWMMDILNPKYT